MDPDWGQGILHIKPRERLVSGVLDMEVMVQDIVRNGYCVMV